MMFISYGYRDTVADELVSRGTTIELSAENSKGAPSV